MSRERVGVYADWHPIEKPLLIGQLAYSDLGRGGVFSFAYDKAFLTSPYCLQIDPLLTLHAGELYKFGLGIREFECEKCGLVQCRDLAAAKSVANTGEKS